MSIKMSILTLTIRYQNIRVNFFDCINIYMGNLVKINLVCNHSPLLIRS